MRALDPPGAAWLLRHELKLGWRSLGGSRKLLGVLGLLIWLGFHFPAWLVVGRLRPDRWVAAAAP